MRLSKPRILIVNLGAIGDIVMATPLVQSIRETYPDACIHWIADHRDAPILQNLDGLDEVIPFNANDWQRLFRRLHWPSYIRATKELRRNLRGFDPDVVLNLNAEKWWAVSFNVAPNCYGLFNSANSPWRGFYSDSCAHPYSMQTTRFSMAIAKLIDCSPDITQMRVGKLADETAFLERYFSTHGIDKHRRLVVMSPFTSAVRKDWPADRYAKLADYIADRHQTQILLSHSPVDTQRAVDLSTMTSAQVILSGDTGLLEYAALLSAADLVVCNDSSALHIAAATGTRTVAIFGPTMASEKAPCCGNVKVLTPHDDPTETGAVEEVSFERVIDAVNSQWARLTT